MPTFNLLSLPQKLFILIIIAFLSMKSIQAQTLTCVATGDIDIGEQWGTIKKGEEVNINIKFITSSPEYLPLLYKGNSYLADKKSLKNLKLKSIDAKNIINSLDAVAQYFYDYEIPERKPALVSQIESSDESLLNQLEQSQLIFKQPFLQDYLDQLLMNMARPVGLTTAELPRLIILKSDNLKIWSTDSKEIYISLGLLTHLKSNDEFIAAISRELLKMHFGYQYEVFRKNETHKEILNWAKAGSQILGINSYIESYDPRNTMLYQDYVSVFQKYGVVSLPSNYEQELLDFFQIKNYTEEQEELLDFSTYQLLKSQGYSPTSLVDYLRLLKRGNYNFQKDEDATVRNGTNYISVRLANFDSIKTEVIHDTYNANIAPASSYLGKLYTKDRRYVDAIMVLEDLKRQKIATSEDILFLSIATRHNTYGALKARSMVKEIDKYIEKDEAPSELYLEKSLWLKREGKNWKLLRH